MTALVMSVATRLWPIPVMVRLLLSGVISLGLVGVALAEDLDIRFSGFGTLGVAWSSQRHADFVNTAQPYGPGRSRSLDAGLDSMLALQADVKLTPRLDGVVQAAVGRTVHGRFEAELTLANLRYEWSDDLMLRVGRLPPTLALAAEYRRVNFALPWPRPPAEVYGLFSAAASDGAEVLLRTYHDLGTIDWRIGTNGVDSKAPFSNDSRIGLSRAQTVFVTADLARGDWRWKLSLSQSHSSTRTRPALEPLFSEIRRIDPALTMNFDNEMGFTYLGLGLLYDGPRWLVMTEWLSRRASHGWAADQQGAYLTVGRPVGPTMPYVTLARRTTANDSATYVTSPAYGLISATYAFQRQNQSTLAFGVRHELSAGLRLKAQMDFIRPDRDSRGLYTNHGPSFNVAHPPVGRLYSVGVDFMF